MSLEAVGNSSVNEMVGELVYESPAAIEATYEASVTTPLETLEAVTHESAEAYRAKLGKELGRLSLDLNLKMELYNSHVCEIILADATIEPSQRDDLAMRDRQWLTEALAEEKQKLNEITRNYNTGIRQMIIINDVLRYLDADRHAIAQRQQRPIDPGSAMGGYDNEGYLDIAPNR